MKPPKLNLLQASRMTEDEARRYIESIIWPDGPVCPHCKSKKTWKIDGESVRSGLYKCAECHKQYTVTVGTIMHGSHLSLQQWVIAFHLMTSSKKGVSALQLQRNLGLGSYRTAWHLAHRIRLAMQTKPVKAMLKGTVEVDETYIGGKPRKANLGTQKKSKRGRGTKKTPVLALVERKGRVHTQVITRVNAKTLKGAIREFVHKDSTIMTDEWPAYVGIGKHFRGGHGFVKHSESQYAIDEISTNTVESYFAIFNRGVHGTFHHVSKHHLPRYCDEFSFRWNHRGLIDGEVVIRAIKGSEGRRLSYKPIIGLN